MINFYLIFIVAIVSVLSQKNRRLLAFVSVINISQAVLSPDCISYVSAFFSDMIILFTALRYKGRFPIRLAIISLCFMVTHVYGFIIYSLYIEPVTYDNTLSCLYCILIAEIITNGGVLNELKRSADRYLDGALRRAMWFMDLQ